MADQRCEMIGCSDGVALSQMRLLWVPLLFVLVNWSCAQDKHTSNRFVQSDRASRSNSTGALVYLRLNDHEDIIVCLTRKESRLTVDSCSAANRAAQGWYVCAEQRK
jgi:hypothetical protein